MHLLCHAIKSRTSYVQAVNKHQRKYSELFRIVIHMWRYEFQTGVLFNKIVIIRLIYIYKCTRKTDKSQTLIKLSSLQSVETVINHHVYKQWPGNDSDINMHSFSCLLICLICLLLASRVWVSTKLMMVIAILATVINKCKDMQRKVKWLTSVSDVYFIKQWALNY